MGTFNFEIGFTSSENRIGNCVGVLVNQIKSIQPVILMQHRIQQNTCCPFAEPQPIEILT